MNKISDFKILNFFNKATVRQMTTDYAMMLSDIVKNVTITKKYKNFDMFYVDFPLEQSKNMI